jgi:RNA polymerase sigma-70 factor (ECF subfamily)
LDPQPRRSAGEALLEHRGFVHALAQRLVGADDAPELTQEAALAGLLRPPQHDRAWRGWLRATVAHLASNLLRGRRRSRARDESAARPEALPSTVELVQRLELEQRVVAAVLTLPEPERAVVLLHFYDGQKTAAIAERLGVPADTVRARLRRALARLRCELDREYGRRDTWQRALLPPGLSIGLQLGASVMAAKGVAVAIAAGVVAVVGWWALPSNEGSRGAAPGFASANEAALAVASGRLAPAADADALAAGPRADRIEQARDAAPQADPSAAAPLPPPGFVAFRAVDRDTRLPLPRVEVRFLAEKRFGVYQGGGEGKAKLTPGHWRALATSEGFEPVELSAFDVREAVETELGTIELAHGGGSIEGRVTARHVTDRDVTVELRGEGRSPCAACRDALLRCAREGSRDSDEDGIPDVAATMKPLGADCGFAKDRSLASIAPGGTFRFSELAAGTYWIRALDEGADLIDVQRVTIARDGNAWVDLDVSSRTTLVVELRNAQGHAFTGAWKHPHREEPAPLRFEVFCGQAHGAVQAQPTVEDVLVTMEPPLLLPPDDPDPRLSSLPVFERIEAEQILVGAIEAHERASGIAILREIPVLGSLFELDRLDRERTETDALWSEPPAALPEAKLTITRERADRYAIGPLPRAQVSLVVQCATFTSEETKADLRFGFTGPLVVTLLPTVAPVEGAGPTNVAASCASCHQATADQLLPGASGR